MRSSSPACRRRDWIHPPKPRPKSSPAGSTSTSSVSRPRPARWTRSFVITNRQSAIGNRQLKSSWTASSPPRSSASAGRVRGSITPATPTRTASSATTSATSGRIATGWSARSTPICLSRSSPSSNSPATSCPTPPNPSALPPASIATRPRTSRLARTPRRRA